MPTCSGVFALFDPKPRPGFFARGFRRCRVLPMIRSFGASVKAAPVIYGPNSVLNLADEWVNIKSARRFEGPFGPGSAGTLVEFKGSGHKSVEDFKAEPGSQHPQMTMRCWSLWKCRRIVLLEIGGGGKFAELLPFAGNGLHEVPHLHCASFAGREERGGERGVLDVAAGHRELSTEKSEIQVVAQRRLRRKHPAPQQVRDGSRRETGTRR